MDTVACVTVTQGKFETCRRTDGFSVLSAMKVSNK
jgi:hypothetical protein